MPLVHEICQNVDNLKREENERYYRYFGKSIK